MSCGIKGSHSKKIDQSGSVATIFSMSIDVVLAPLLPTFLALVPRSRDIVLTCPIPMSRPVVSKEVLVVDRFEVATLVLAWGRASMKFCVLASREFLMSTHEISTEGRERAVWGDLLKLVLLGESLGAVFTRKLRLLS